MDSILKAYIVEKLGYADVDEVQKRASFVFIKLYLNSFEGPIITHWVVVVDFGAKTQEESTVVTRS